MKLRAYTYFYSRHLRRTLTPFEHERSYTSLLSKWRQTYPYQRITIRTTGLKLIKTKIHSPSRKTMLMIICTDPSLHFTFATNIERGERGNDVFKTILWVGTICTPVPVLYVGFILCWVIRRHSSSSFS